MPLLASIDISVLTNIGALAVTIAIASGSYFGFKNNKDKNSSEQVREIIDNYKELSASLSATVEQMQRKIDEGQKLNSAQAAQMVAQDAQMTEERSAWVAERLKMKADFEYERAHWIAQISNCEEKLRAK